MTVVPMSVIPTFAVPLFLILHIIFIAQAVRWPNAAPSLSASSSWNAPTPNERTS